MIVDAGVRHVQYSDSQPPLVYDCFTAACERPVTPNGFALVSQKESGGLLSLMEACRRELNDGERGHFAAANAYFRLLLIGLLRLIAPKESEKKQSVADRVKTYIKAHYDEDLSLDDLAARFYVNKNTLLHAFKRAFRISPMQYRNVCRIERAKILLSGGLGVTDAALAVGFSNPVYFAEVFRRKEGVPPSTYGKQNKKTLLLP